MNVILRQAFPHPQRSDSELVEPMLTLTLYRGPRILVSIKEKHKKTVFLARNLSFWPKNPTFAIRPQFWLMTHF